VGPRAGLDAVEKRKIFCPCWKSNLGFSVVQLIVPSLCTDFTYVHKGKVKLSLYLITHAMKIYDGLGL
jgi:hypothetical protein